MKTNTNLSIDANRCQATQNFVTGPFYTFSIHVLNQKVAYPTVEINDEPHIIFWLSEDERNAAMTSSTFQPETRKLEESEDLVKEQGYSAAFCIDNTYGVPIFKGKRSEWFGLETAEDFDDVATAK